MTSQPYIPKTSGSAASKFGQMIGEAFERAVLKLIATHLESQHPDYEVLAPEKGKKLITLQTLGGTPRRLDTVVVAKESIDPVALLETKWLKDARHHNDKGAWILQLREVRKHYPTIRGAVAILAGYWTEGVGVMLASNAGVKMVLVATDEEVYSTLQEPLDAYLGEDSFSLEPDVMRHSYPNAHLLANFLIALHGHGKLDLLADQWLNFVREDAGEGHRLTGGDKVKIALDELLSPLPPNPRIQRYEIALQIDTGNTIYQEFDDLETLIEFIKTHVENPETILQRIRPRKKQQ